MTFWTCGFPLFDLEGTVNPRNALMKSFGLHRSRRRPVFSPRYMEARCYASPQTISGGESLHFGNCYVLDARKKLMTSLIILQS